MSKVYSFRLDKNNPREAQAMRVIVSWVDEGYSLRSQLVNLIISSREGAAEYSELLKQIERLIGDSNMKEVEESSDKKLSDTFVTALKRSTKEGLSI